MQPCPFLVVISYISFWWQCSLRQRRAAVQGKLNTTTLEHGGPRVGAGE